jgi:hypothetical protein
MLRRDLGGLADRVYFFIDRDFDDYRGYDPDPVTTFMTDQYSVENYLVTRGVLEELLKDEFHCHAEPLVRNQVLDRFDECLKQFLVSTEAINFRLFIARRRGFTLCRHLPNRANNVATIGITDVRALNCSPQEIIVFEEAVSSEDERQLRQEFESLNPPERYRGKFNLLFFMKWLELLATDRRTEPPTIFSEVAKPYSVNLAAISLGMLASKAQSPLGLRDFLAQITT